MASTATQVVAKFRAGGFYPDCPSAVADGLFADALKWLTWKLRLRATAIAVPLTAGIREVALPEGVVAIREAYLEPGEAPGSWQALQGTTVDLLARLEPGWRSGGSPGTPQRYYVDQASDGDSGQRVIGFDPIPDASTSGTYPRVRIYAVQTAEITEGEPVPVGIFTDDVILYEMAYRWAVRQDPGRVGLWKAMRDEAVGDNANVGKSFVDEAPPQIFLSPFTNRTSRPV
ncbi:MAG: hypothetical protein ACO1SV_00750 [Fimbriimonas sp.]